MNYNVVIVILIIGKISANDINKPNNIFAENILRRLKQEKWNEDEYPCLIASLRLLKGAKNNTIWSTWVLDSMQLPVGALYGSRYHLGNFDQCLDDIWSSTHPELEMQYCLVDITAEEVPDTPPFHHGDPYKDVEDFIRSRTRHGRRRYLNSFGVCTPSSCSPHSVERISKHIISSSHLRYGDVTVVPWNCQKLKQDLEYSIGFYVFWFIIVLLTSILVVIYLFEDNFKNSEWSEMSSWFSPSRNYKALTAVSSDEVKSLNGIRSISCGITVVIHYLYCINVLSIINHSNVGKDLESTVGKILAHLDLLIDSFFVLSGFLLVKGLCSSKSINIWSILSKRYKRLIAPYVMILLYMVYVSPHTGSGPLWPMYMKDQQERCVRNWWTGLLMMGNIINSDDICYIVTWYLSCDFQLAILGVIIFYFWKQNLRNKISIFSIGIVTFIAVPSVLTYHNQISHILLHDLDEAFDVSENRTFKILYLKFYNRASSYLIGFATGYVMTVYKPHEYKKIFSKTFSILCSLIIAYIVGSMLYATGSLMFKKYDGIRFAIYAGFDRVIWSMGLCALIALCEYGTLPIVSDLLSSKVFVPLSRLAYGTYLIHMAIVYRNLYSLRAPVTYDFFHLVINGLGYIVISMALSYLQWFIIEAPASNMFNYLQKSYKTKQCDAKENTSILHDKNGKNN